MVLGVRRVEEPGPPRRGGHGRDRPRGGLLDGPGPAARVRTVEIPTPTPEARLAAGSSNLSDPVLAAAERDYEAAANALLEALQQRRARLQPEDLAAVEANLDVIDRALAEVRQALARSPESPELGRMLVSTHRKKVEVLSRVVKPVDGPLR